MNSEQAWIPKEVVFKVLARHFPWSVRNIADNIKMLSKAEI
jgi:hypothetical protein